MSQNSEHTLLTWVITALKWLASFLAAFWITIDLDLRVLVVLSVADIVSTFFNPHRSLPGTTRRITVTFLLVGVTHYVFNVAKNQTGLNLGFDVAAVVCTFYILGEIIAVVRNCAAAGLTIPPQLLSALTKAEGLSGVDKQEIEALQLKQTQESSALELKQEQQKEAAALPPVQSAPTDAANPKKDL
jgi:phage-related holin